MLLEDALTEQLIGAAIAVHRTLGPGLLESAYEACYCAELREASVAFEKQVPVPYKGARLQCGYRVDLVVERKIVVELKSIPVIRPIHKAQLLT